MGAQVALAEVQFPAAAALSRDHYPTNKELTTSGWREYLPALRTIRYMEERSRPSSWGRKFAGSCVREHWPQTLVLEQKVGQL